MDPCFRSEFTFKSVKFPTVFHAYFYQKATHHDLDASIVLECDNGWEVLDLGCDMTSDDDWLRTRSQLLLEILTTLVQQPSKTSVAVREALRVSDGKTIVYNIYNRYFGTGVSRLTFRYIHEQYVGGRNQLGIAWGQVRRDLKLN